MPRSDAVVDRRALLQEAASWLVRLDADELSLAERQALQRWYQTSPEHERVWQAACELNRQFARVPNDLAKPVLGRDRLGRRAVLKSLAGAGLLLPVGWTVAQHRPWQPWIADYRSAVGEQRSLILADGSELTLNTDTALDVHFDSQRRQVHLFAGEVVIRTGNDPHRPFSVATEQGTIRALGTEFTVRCLTGATQVGVVKSAVMVSPQSGATPQRLESGQQCRFTPRQIEVISELSPDSLAWQRGELIVDSWPLGVFIEELARYRPGILRCNSAVARLKVSGVFQTDNTDQALEVLEQMLGVKVTRFTDYWVSVG